MRPLIARLDHGARRAHHRADDFDMCAAAAQIIAQRLHGLLFGWMRVACEKCLRRHDHAIEAIAALRGLLGDEGVLYGIRVVARAEPFEGYDLAADTAFNRNDTRSRRDTIDQHATGTALAEAAAIFRSVELEIVAQDVEQGGLGRRAHFMDPAIDVEADRRLDHA